MHLISNAKIELNNCKYVLFEGSKIKKLKNIYKNERCFIIGNGPSINQQNLTKLKDEFSFVTNWFVLYEKYAQINPKFYCVSDPNFFQNIDPSWYSLMISKAKKTKKFFPYSARYSIQHTNLFHNQEVYYLNYCAGFSWISGKTNIDLLKPLYCGDTIIIDFCLPIAYYMGFKEIYLLGCDCNLGSNKETSQQSHFYENKYHKTKQSSNEYLRDQWLNNILKSYEIINVEFEKNNRKIFNAGVGGNLELFERVKLEELF